MYLRMDGVDDYLQVPALSEAKIVMDIEVDTDIDFLSFHPAIISGSGNFRIYANSDTSWYYNDTKIAQVYADDNLATNNTQFIPTGRRFTLEALYAPGQINYWAFTLFAYDNTRGYLKGKIYDVKFYDASGNLVAHYDMSTGTVNDQSGKGKHAILNGGTWVDDVTTNIIAKLYADGTLKIKGELAEGDALSFQTNGDFHTGELIEGQGLRVNGQTIYVTEFIEGGI